MHFQLFCLLYFVLFYIQLYSLIFVQMRGGGWMIYYTL
jgi:hypothetical protein